MFLRVFKPFVVAICSLREENSSDAGGWEFGTVKVATSAGIGRPAIDIADARELPRLDRNGVPGAVSMPQARAPSLSMQ